MSGLVSKNIAMQLSAGVTNKKNRENDISGFVNTTVVDVYTDSWLYDGIDAVTAIPDKIQHVNKRYIEAGYAGIPYHYIVTNFDGTSADKPAYYITKQYFTASDLNSKNIAVCLCARTGISLDSNSEQGMNNLISNLKSVLRLILNTLRISPKNLNLDTIGQNCNGQKSFSGANAFKKALLEEIAKEHNLSSDANYIVVAGPADKSKRTLECLSNEIYGNINSTFINTVKNYSGMENHGASEAIALGTFLCLPSGLNYSSANRSEVELSNILNTGLANTDSLSYVNECLSAYQNNLTQIDPNQISSITNRSKTSLSTNRGGKEDPDWIYKRMELPGYHNAFLQFEKIDSSEDPVYMQFLIGPSDFSESRSNMFSNSKTMGGWISQRSGKNTISIQFSGYMLDIKSQMERHVFLEQYKRYIEDEKVEDQTYINRYKQKFVIEGREYYGHLVGVDFSKSADKQFLYKYNMAFLAYNDKKIYDASWAVLDMQLLDAGIVSSSYVSQTVAETTNAFGETVAKGTAAYDYLQGLIASIGNDEAALAKIKNSLANYSSNHWAKKYLDALINADVVTNIEDWGNYDNIAPISHCVALAYKALVGGNAEGGSAGKWSSKYMYSLYTKSCVSYDIYMSYSVSAETDPMPRGWMLDIMCLSLAKNNSSVRSLYQEAKRYFDSGTNVLNQGFYASQSKYNNIYEVYLDVLCKTGYINTPSEWTNFNGSMTNGDALAIISKAGGYKAKD